MSEELLHGRVLCANRNAELRAVARSVFLGYVVSLAIGCSSFSFLRASRPSASSLIGVILTATLPFAAVARSGQRATGVGYDRKVTVLQFIAGFALFAVQRIDGS